jgi:hypothetical protein
MVQGWATEEVIDFNLSLGHSSFMVWYIKHCSSCFCLWETVISCFFVYETRVVSTGQFFFEFFCLLNIVRCLTDKFMKLQCSMDKNRMKSVFQTKPQTRSVPQKNVPNFLDYMDLQAIAKPISHHEGRLSGKGT